MVNVGPTGAGEISSGAVESLKQVGDWLRMNGAAIYGSQPWKIAQEGPTEVPFESTTQRQKEGFHAEFTSDDFSFTQKGDKIYAIALVRPKDGAAKIESLSGLPIDSIEVLGQPGDVQWSDTGDAIELRLPAFQTDGIGYALEVRLQTP